MTYHVVIFSERPSIHAVPSSGDSLNSSLAQLSIDGVVSRCSFWRENLAHVGAVFKYAESADSVFDNTSNGDSHIVYMT